MTLCPPCGQAPMRSRSHVASKRAHDEHARQADHGYVAGGLARLFPKEIHMKHPFASTNDAVLRPVRRGFLQASSLVLSGTAIALLAGREALATEVQDVTALRRGIDETHRRFEDLFNRGRAADGRAAGGAVHARSAAAGRRGLRDRARHADARERPAGDAEVLRGLEAGGWRLAPARGHLEHGHSLSTSNTKGVQHEHYYEAVYDYRGVGAVGGHSAHPGSANRTG